MKRQKYKTINLWISSFMVYLLSNLAVVSWAAADLPQADATDRAQEMLHHNHLDQAITLMRAQLDKNPLDLAARRRLVELYLLTDNRYEAEILLTQAQSLYPNGIEPIVMEADIDVGPLVTQGDIAQEERTLSHLSREATEAKYISDSNPGTYYIQGVVAKLQANNEAAEEYFLRALYQQPNYLKAQQALVELYADQHQPRLAVPLLSAALEEEPQNVDTLYLVGHVFIEKGDPGRGLIYLKQSQALDPKDRPKRLYLMAEAQRQLGQIPEALDNYQKILTYWPNRADIWQKYAQLAEGMQQDDRALEAYKRAYALQPSILNSFLADAEQAFWAKSLIQAIPLYRRVLQIAPEREDILTLLVSMHFRLWEEGVTPLPSALDELEKDLREHERQNLIPPLQLADIEIQVMRGNQWTPGLQEVASQVTQSALSPYMQAAGDILLDEPYAAQQVYPKLGPPMDPRQEIQRFVLLGAWPWASEQVAHTAALSSMQGWVDEWREQQVVKFRDAINQAQLFNQSNQPELALASLEKARVYHPLSPEIRIQRAAVYLKQGKLEETQAALKYAATMQLSPLQQSQIEDLLKQLTLAYTQKKP